MQNPEPVERIYNLANLSEAGYETAITASPEELAWLAAWAKVEAVNRFAAKISLKRLSKTRFVYHAALEADLVQACVVTLEPVEARIALDFSRTLELVRKVRDALELIGPLDPTAGDDDVPEEIESTRYDLAGPLLEEFSLAIDPYPRAPGVAFETPASPKDEHENPFAKLKALKDQG